MLWQLLITVSAIALMLVGWLLVQYWARAFATQHPEFGPAREEGSGCGGSGRCSCASQGAHCERKV